MADADRMRVIHNVPLIPPLPESYLGRIAATEADVSHMTWFGGIYQEPVPLLRAVRGRRGELLRLYPELGLTDQERRRWLANRTGPSSVGRRRNASGGRWTTASRCKGDLAHA